MKENSKLNSGALGRIGAEAVLLVAMIFWGSCTSADHHTHIPDKSVKTLDGLVRPVDQVVFSNVNVISAKNFTLRPLLSVNAVVSYDPKYSADISSRFGGRIEKLYVHYTYQDVIAGQRLMDVYSPEIVAEQQNLIYLLRDSINESENIFSTDRKLQLLGLTLSQIKQIHVSRQIINPIPLLCPISGFVLDIIQPESFDVSQISDNSSMNGGMTTTSSSVSNANDQLGIYSSIKELPLKEGMYINSKQPLFKVYDSSAAWLILNISQEDAHYVHQGDPVKLIVNSDETDTLNGSVKFIESIAQRAPGSIRARVTLNDSDKKSFKIGSHFSAFVVAGGIQAAWVPRSAVVSLGIRNIAFIKTDGHFVATEIKTGYKNDSLIQVISGLSDGQLIAKDAQYLIDSESFIAPNEDER